MNNVFIWALNVLLWCQLIHLASRVYIVGAFKGKNRMCKCVCVYLICLHGVCYRYILWPEAQCSSPIGLWKEASTCWLSPISSKQCSVEGASLDFFFQDQSIKLCSVIFNNQNTHKFLRSHVQTCSKDLNTNRQTDRQTDISMQKNLKGKLCTFISFLSPRCLDVSRSQMKQWWWTDSICETELKLGYISHSNTYGLHCDVGNHGERHWIAQIVLVGVILCDQHCKTGCCGQLSVYLYCKSCL